MITATREPPAIHHATELSPPGTTTSGGPELTPSGTRVTAPPRSPASPAPHLVQKRAPGVGVCPHAGQGRAAREAPHDEQKLPAAAAPHREHEGEDMKRSDQLQPDPKPERAWKLWIMPLDVGSCDRIGSPQRCVAKVTFR
jgi:hypothetical protein